MSRFRQKTKWILLVAFVWSILAFQFLSILWVQWRERSVYQSLRSGIGPEFWWPPRWRREFRTSTLLEGEAKLREDEHESPRPQNHAQSKALGRPVAAGVIELVSDNSDRAFRAIVVKGKYSFLPQLLPAGPFKIRLTTPDGRATGWLRAGPLDSGIHRINWLFSKTPGSGS